jgi:asparagine synthase (glutamine-hydrolysing)
MYFCQKPSGIKVSCREGADEVFGGYLYFRNAPSAVEFQKESIERVHLLLIC